ncbi:MAG TPA: hypothetical protein VLK36_00435, partial [Gaiellaceae bacterium]|nr:hypothetical protein [Gaiellaceae bacterium]
MTQPPARVVLVEDSDSFREMLEMVLEPVSEVTVAAALALLAIGIQHRLERGTTDEEIDAFVARYQKEHRLLFTVNTLEYLA